MTLFSRALLPAVLIAGTAVTSLGVPASPRPLVGKAADGSAYTYYLRGDENRHWLETPDGFALQCNPAGELLYLMRGKDGRVRPSSIRYEGQHLAANDSIIRGLRPEREADLRKAPAKAQSALQLDVSFPPSGKRKLLMLLVNFSNTRPIYSSKQFADMMNQEGYKGIGSFRDYYLEQSYGQLDIETTVTDWITLPGPKSDYPDGDMTQLISHALDALGDDIDLRDFDNDGDGVLDGLAIIHQGMGREVSASDADIWSHSSSVAGVMRNGVRVKTYTIEPELLTGTQITNIGVICHEFAHNLGSPDFYDTDYETGGSYPGTGCWDLMGGGAWLGNYGDCPAGINIWQRAQFGWIEPTVLDRTATGLTLRPADKNAECYRVNTTVEGEYFLLECRSNRSGAFDSSLPGSGLIVYHVDENLIAANLAYNSINSTFPQALYTVCASATSDPRDNPTSFGPIDSEYCPFPGADNVSGISDGSQPSLRSRTGRSSYCEITDIRFENGESRFSFKQLEVPQSPQLLAARAMRGRVELTWEAPEGNPVKYSVYCEGTLIGETAKTSFTDAKPGRSGVMRYEVDATYADGRVSPGASVVTRIAAQYASSLSAIEADGGVRLSWKIPAYLTRSINTATPALKAYNTPYMEIAQRLRAEDISIFAGKKINRLGFMSAMGQKDVSVTVRIYRKAPGSERLEVLSERKVSEFGLYSWTDAVLPKKPQIPTDGSELWLSVIFENPEGGVNLLTDNSLSGAAPGNLMRQDAGGDWSADSYADGSFMIRAALTDGTSAESREADYEGTSDGELDLIFPLGFLIYRDGALIGSTTGCDYADNSADAGEHAYEVVSVYRGGSESEALTATCVFSGESGIDALPAGSRSMRPVKIVSDGTVTFSDSGEVRIYNLSGSPVFFDPDYVGGTPINLPPGIYLRN